MLGLRHYAQGNRAAGLVCAAVARGSVVGEPPPKCCFRITDRGVGGGPLQVCIRGVALWKGVHTKKAFVVMCKNLSEGFLTWRCHAARHRRLDLVPSLADVSMLSGSISFFKYARVFVESANRRGEK